MFHDTYRETLSNYTYVSKPIPEPEISYNLAKFIRGKEMESQRYEFDQSQNQLVRDLAQKMRFVSYFLIALGVLLIVGGIFNLRRGEIGSIISGVVQVIIGFWTNRAATAFQRIVDTQGSDIENLMGALGELRKLYTLQYWLILIAIIFIIIAIVVALIFGTFTIIR